MLPKFLARVGDAVQFYGNILANRKGLQQQNPRATAAKWRNACLVDVQEATELEECLPGGGGCMDEARRRDPWRTPRIIVLRLHRLLRLI